MEKEVSEVCKMYVRLKWLKDFESPMWDKETEYLKNIGAKWSDIFKHNKDTGELTTLEGEPIYFVLSNSASIWGSYDVEEIDDLELLYLERMKKCL